MQEGPRPPDERGPRWRVPVITGAISAVLTYILAFTLDWYVKLPVALLCGLVVGFFSYGYALGDEPDAEP